MAKQPSEGSGGPDLFEALRGMAHLSDMAQRAMGKDDPNLRNQVEMLGNADMKQVIAAAGNAVNSKTPQPHMDLRDTEDGLDILVDTSDTPVNPTNLTTIYDDQEVTLMEPQSGWEATVSTESTVDHIDVTTSESSVATVKVSFAGGRDDFTPTDDDVDEADTTDPDSDSAPTPDSDDSTTDMTDTNDSADDTFDADSIDEVIKELDEDMTLNEALGEYPDLAEMAEDELDEKMLTSARLMFGDTPLKDIPLEQVLPEEYTDALDDVQTGEDTGFDFGSDPLSGDDDV